jgi:hypothetical protein
MSMPPTVTVQNISQQSLGIVAKSSRYNTYNHIWLKKGEVVTVSESSVTSSMQELSSRQLIKITKGK